MRANIAAVFLGFGIFAAVFALSACLPKEQLATIPAPPPDLTPAISQPSKTIVQRTVDVKPVCGTVKVLNQAETKALTDLVKGLSGTDPLLGVIGDYKRMRDEARACHDYK